MVEALSIGVSFCPRNHPNWLVKWSFTSSSPVQRKQSQFMPAIKRRKSVVVNVGGVNVGGSHPVVVQSMTNTDTADTAATVNQVMDLARAGSELVRVTVNTDDAAKAVPRIVETLRTFGVHVPIVGDFHYNGHLLLK